MEQPTELLEQLNNPKSYFFSPKLAAYIDHLTALTQWQPIETAPKDGTVFLGWDINCEHPYVTIPWPTYWSDQRSSFTRLGDCSKFNATHWTPLLEPPEVSQ